MQPLTKKQHNILKHIAAQVRKNGYSPTAAEVGDHFGISTNAAYEHIRALFKKGALTSAPGKQRTTKPVKGFVVRIKK